MKKFNKFLKGQINEDGTTNQVEVKPPVKVKGEGFTLDEAQMEMVADFLNKAEECLKLTDNSQIATVLESLIMSQPRDKLLKNTKSWSTNAILKLYHCHRSN